MGQELGEAVEGAVELLTARDKVLDINTRDMELSFRNSG